VKTAVLIALAALVAATTLAAPASAATPTERRLARQVKTLQKQVKALQRQVRSVQSIAAGAIVYGACVTAATADAFQATWETIDKDAVRDVQPEFFGPQTPIADPLNSCQRLEVQRQANPAATPTTDVFAALLNIFR
jgi:endonuclease/exonuclease/phosphatase (EEP) superfamily protein YafD